MPNQDENAVAAERTAADYNAINSKERYLSSLPNLKKIKKHVCTLG